MRLIAFAAALPLLALGGVALVWAFAPDAPLAAALRELADQALAAGSLGERLGGVADLEAKLVGDKAGYVPAGMGLLLLLVSLWPRGKSEAGFVGRSPRNAAPIRYGSINRLVARNESAGR